MEMQPRWLSILSSQIWTIPYLAIYSVGILLALIRWYRHPQVSSFALLGFLILLLNTLFSVGLNLWLMSGQRIELAGLMGIVGVIRSLFAVAAYGLLMVAIFGWRQTAALPYHGKPEI